MRKKMATLILLLVLASISTVTYAILELGTFFSGEVTTVVVEGDVTLSQTTDAITWLDTLTSVNVGGSWYARFEVVGDGYTGPVTITWTLQEIIDADPVDTTYYTETIFTLDGSSHIIYASPDGTITGIKDWGEHTTEAGTWQIKCLVEEP